MAEFIDFYFKTNKDNALYKCDIDYDQYAGNPRVEYDTQNGVVLLSDNRNLCKGRYDIYADDIQDYMIAELPHSDKNFFRADLSYSGKLPDVAECRANERLSHFVLPEKKEYGLPERVDYELMYQELQAAIDDTAGIDGLERLDAGFNVEKGTFEIQADTSDLCRRGNENKPVDEDVCYNEAVSLSVEIAERLNEFGLAVRSIDFDHKLINPITQLSAQELFQEWAETKVCARVCKDGYMFIDKDSEYIKELKDAGVSDDKELHEKCERFLDGCVDEFNAWCEGNVYLASFREYNRATGEWGEPDYVGGIYEDKSAKWHSPEWFDAFTGAMFATGSENITYLLNSPEIDAELSVENPENRKAVFDAFIKDVNELTPDMDGNWKHAVTAVNAQWKQNYPDRIPAFHEFCARHGGTSPRNFDALVVGNLDLPGLPENPGTAVTRSYYSSDINAVLLVDDNSKRFAIVRDHDGEFASVADAVSDKYELFNEAATLFVNGGYLDASDKTNAGNKELSLRFNGGKSVARIYEQEAEQKMFNDLFKDAEQSSDYSDYKEYTEHFVVPAGMSNSGVTGEKWWIKAVEHACNSGGALWQPTDERRKLFKEYGLDMKTLREDCLAVNDPDKLYGQLMYNYLKRNKAFNPSVSPNMSQEKKLPSLGHKKNEEPSIGR